MAFSDKDTGIPLVPRTADAETQRFLGAVKTQVELLSGQNGDATKRAVRVTELEDGSLAVDGSGPSTAGTGNRTLKAPTNLQAFNLMVAIRLTWDNVETEYSHVEVWCAFDSTYLNDAVLVGVVTKPVKEFVHNATSTRQAHTYFIRAVGWDGSISPWTPTQGGLVVPAPNDTTINDLLRKLFDDTRYNTSHVIVADTFKVLLPNAALNTAKTVFAVGNVDGVPTVGIDGNMVVDGTILTRMLDADCVTADKIGAGEINAGHIQADAIDGTHIAADASIKLNEGGKLTAGMNNIIVDSNDDSIIVAPDNGTVVGTPNLSGKDYARLKNGDIEFFMWGGSAHVMHKSLRRMETGTCVSNALVQIPGYFKNRPKVALFPAQIKSYDPTYSNSAQTISATLVPLTGGDTIREFQSKRYEFQPRLELKIEAAGDYQLQTGTFLTSQNWPEVWQTNTEETVKTYSIPVGADYFRIVGTGQSYEYDSDNTWNFRDRIDVGCVRIYVDGVLRKQTPYAEPNNEFPALSDNFDWATSLDPLVSHTVNVNVYGRGGWGFNMGPPRVYVSSAYWHSGGATTIASGVINWIAYD